MVNINRIQNTPATQTPGRVNKKFKQDSPEPGVVYGDVHRSEGDAEETIQAILYFAKQQVQDAIGGAEDPQWAHAMVHRTAATMAASTFVAKINDKCRMCPVKSSCPVSGKGRQVVEP